MRKLGPLITAVLGAALIALLVFGLTKQGTSRALDQALAAGRQPPAPDINRPLPVLDDVQGPTARLTRWRGGVVIVNSWASWCPPCAVEAPLLERAQRMLAADHAGTVVGITYKDVTNDALAAIKSFGLSYPNLRDVNGSYAAGYGTDKIPETFVLNRQLHVVAISRGEITEQSWLTGAIAEAERT
jgi:cytochrome c biogenesis protein CcmG, thiol:disulfide interchange protein DsbE